MPDFLPQNVCHIAESTRQAQSLDPPHSSDWCKVKLIGLHCMAQAALLTAAQLLDVDAVILLLQLGADPTTVNAAGNTPAHMVGLYRIEPVRFVIT